MHTRVTFIGGTAGHHNRWSACILQVHMVS